MKRFLTQSTPTCSNASNTRDKNSSESEYDSEEEKRVMAPKKLYMHKFNPQWLTQFNWLREGRGSTSCQCWNSGIVGSLTHIKRHEQTERHKKLIKAFQCTPRISLVFKNEEKLIHEKQVYAGELKMTMFLHEHNLPFLLMEHLPKLIQSICPDSKIAKDFNCGRTKATAITNTCLAEESLEVFHKQLKEGDGFYSLIIDETTDVSTKKALAVVLRFCHQNRPKDRFLGLIEVGSATAESLLNY